MKKAIVLLSGGIDSTVTLAIAKKEGFEIYAVSFNYGQRHSIELSLAKHSAESLNVQKHLVIRVNLKEIGGSALTSDIEVPKKSTEELKRGGAEATSRLTSLRAIPITYVPARNTIFLSFALAFAESIGAEDIFIGVNAVDYSGYPDCRPEFISAFEKMANLATKASAEGTAKFRINAPLIDLAKREIIKKGNALGVDFSRTWSCYDPQKSKTGYGRKTITEKKRKKGISSIIHHPSSIGYSPCGRCDSCLLRAKGFRESGLEDPVNN